MQNGIVTDDWLNAYRAPFPTPAEAVGAIGWAKGFAIGAHQFEEPDPATRALISAKPALAIWGTEDRTLGADQFIPLFRQVFPHAPVLLLPETGHYSPEDAPEFIASRVLEFLKSS